MFLKSVPRCVSKVMSQECITLSSDDEVEYISKKRKTEISESEGAKRLKHLPEITAKKVPQSDGNSDKPPKNEHLNGLTIIINDTGQTPVENDDTIELLDDNSEEDETDSKYVINPFIIQNGHNEKENIQENGNYSGTSSVTLTAVTNDRPSTSTATPIQTLFETYLNACKHTTKQSKYDDKILPKMYSMKDKFYKCMEINDYEIIEQLEKLMLTEIPKVQKSPAEAVISFRDVHSFLMDNTQGSCVEIKVDNVHKVKKLEICMHKLMKKIRKIENMEVDFDAENDSSYIKLDRFNQRLKEVYRKYCMLIDKDPNEGRPTYQSINFSASKYNEINKAIRKAHKHNEFPTYKVVEKLIRKCVQRHELPMTECDILSESKICFEQLGNLLQKRRQRELYESHCNLITNVEDPALNDPSLDEVLKKNRQKGDENLSKVLEKYTKLQQENAQVEISNDSDDSNYEDSDSDDG